MHKQMNHCLKWGGLSNVSRLFCTTSQLKPAPTTVCAWKNVASSNRPELDFDFLLDDNNAALIEQNIRRRKGIGDLHRVRSLWQLLQCFPPFVGKVEAAGTSTTTSCSTSAASNADRLRTLWDQFYAEAALLPNLTDPGAPVGDASAARCVTEFGPTFPAKMPCGEGAGDQRANALFPVEKMVSGWRSLRFPRMGSGGRSYALIGSLSDIEQALLDYAFDFLYERLLNDEKGIGNVELVDVDDILPLSTTRACGVQQRPDTSSPSLQYRVFRANQLRFDDNTSTADCPDSDHQQIADVDADVPSPSDVLRANSFDGFCLSGTAEMGIAHHLRGRVFDERELPTYFMAQSRCFRNEVASNQMDSGLYRVHEFTKIELFVVCTERQSAAELGRIVRLQQSLFDSLQLRCRIMDMPSEELGAPAARKFDLEAWMPGRRSWGELCSASNCTDFQARRLHLKYRPSAGSSDGRPHPFVHTCNGTGLASTRAMIALLETHQTGLQKGVRLPEVIAKRLPIERSAGIWCTQLKNASRLIFD